jgi:hypothetical protein
MQEPQHLRDNEAGRDSPNEWHRYSLSCKLNAPAFIVLAELAISPILSRDLLRPISGVIVYRPKIAHGSRVGQRMQVDRVEVVSGATQATLDYPVELG